MSLIDQIIIASDENLNVLYNNYHERFYEKIMKKLHKYVNMEMMREKRSARLVNLFQKDLPNLVAETKTMKSLLKMAKGFEYNPRNDLNNSFLEKSGILKIVQALYEYSDNVDVQEEYIGGNSSQFLLEAKQNQLVSIELLVSGGYSDVQIHNTGRLRLDSRI